MSDLKQNIFLSKVHILSHCPLAIWSLSDICLYFIKDTDRCLFSRFIFLFTDTVIVNNTDANDTKQAKILAGMAAVEVAENISSAIREAVDSGRFNLSVDGTLFVPDKQSLEISEPKLTCAKGQSYRDGYCGKLLQMQMKTFFVCVASTTKVVTPLFYFSRYFSQLV